MSEANRNLQYRFTDLKYLMQFLQLRMLSQRKGKAAMKALETHISDATLYVLPPWSRPPTLA